MREATEQVIERLVADAGPVRRLRPPTMRAALWLLAVAAIAAAAILLFSDLAVMAERLRDSKLQVEMAATLLTGIAAVLAAFHLSLPDRSPAWALLPLPFLALWVASSGYSCWRHWINFGPGGFELGESAHCLRFMLAISLPLGVSLLLLLRRAAPLTPVRVAAVGGLGIGGIAAFVLQFFHPFDVTFMDLAVHLGSVAVVVAAGSLVERVAQRRHATT
ncbi:MAG TPA: NrsF family protein [Stellaceae bacterium]|nr:NrsF family protein [Stellaceae bacterium]